MRRIVRGLAGASLAAALAALSSPASAQLGGRCVSGQRCPTCPPEPCATVSPGGGSGRVEETAPVIDAAAPYFQRGQAALSAGDTRAAESAFRQALQINPNHGPAWNGLGIAFARQDRISDALNAYARAAGLGIEVARENHATLSAWAKDRDARIARNKAYASQKVQEGIRLLQQGKYTEARTAFLTARNYDPDNRDAKAAGPYLDALQAEQNRRAPAERRRRDQQEARQKAETGMPEWIAESIAAAEKKLRERARYGDSLAWAEAERAGSSSTAARLSSGDDLSSELSRDFFDTDRWQRPKSLPVIGADLDGSQVGPANTAVGGEAPATGVPPPIGKKAERGQQLDAVDLAALEKTRRAAARAVTTAPPQQRQEAERQELEVKIEIVGLAPTAPRRNRFIEPPPPRPPSKDP